MRNAEDKLSVSHKTHIKSRIWLSVTLLKKEKKNKKSGTLNSPFGLLDGKMYQGEDTKDVSLPLQTDKLKWPVLV